MKKIYIIVSTIASLTSLIAIYCSLAFINVQRSLCIGFSLLPASFILSYTADFIYTFHPTITLIILLIANFLIWILIGFIINKLIRK